MFLYYNLSVTELSMFTGCDRGIKSEGSGGHDTTDTENGSRIRGGSQI